MPVLKRRQKDLRVSDFALLLVVFGIYHGSEGVNGYYSIILRSYVPSFMTTVSLNSAASAGLLEALSMIS